MPDRLKYNILLLLIVFLGGCTSVHQSSHHTSDSNRLADHQHDGAYWKKVGSLQDDLATLNRQADLIEARQVAETAIGYSTFLAEKYKVVRPAVLHNVLVRVGLKNRGLCYHWTEDLMGRLQELDLKTYQLHWGVAHRGSELREHNSVVITANGQTFDEGMVLDPWRNSGNLYWSMVKTDRYPWKELPPADW
jgi:hypothetical protein